MKKMLITAVVFFLFTGTDAFAFEDISESLSETEKSDIRAVIAACADITIFDIYNYDYDSLFKYVLYTHENFRVLTDIEPKTTSSSAFGYNRVSLVNSDFVDYVMENVFEIAPQKTPSSSLIRRGFCYSDGYYLYTGGFNVFFSTEIAGIDHVYSIDGETLLILFHDIYTEGNARTGENSFAILRRKNNGYKLLRLGMGKDAPAEDEIQKYSLAYAAEGNDSLPSSKENDRNKFLLPLMLLISAAGAGGVIISAVMWAKTKK